MSKKLTGGVYDSSVWVPYSVTLTFAGRVCGSVPANENVIKSWLESRKPSTKPPSGKTISEINEEVINRLPDETKASVTRANARIGAVKTFLGLHNLGMSYAKLVKGGVRVPAVGALIEVEHTPASLTQK